MEVSSCRKLTVKKSRSTGQRGTRLVFLDAVGDAASEVGLELNNTNGLVEIDVYKLRDVANQNFMLLDYSTSNRMGYPLVI